MNWFVEALKKYAVFNGRSRRKEYWWFYFILIVIGCILAIIEGQFKYPSKMIAIPSKLAWIFGLAMFVPSLAVAVRRIHDIGRTGWWVLIAFLSYILPLRFFIHPSSAWWALIVLLTLIASIIFIVFMLSDSQVGDNKYGPNPKGVYKPKYQQKIEKMKAQRPLYK